MSFEIQDLPDVIRILILIDLCKGAVCKKTEIKYRIDKILKHKMRLNIDDLDKALEEMVSEGLVVKHDNIVQLTEKGMKLGIEWQNLLLRREPILEVVAGITDGSISALVIIISAFIAGLTVRTTVFASLLTLAAVAITNFSSFILGGITEDLADIITIQNLINYSLSDIQDKKERATSLFLVKELFTLLKGEIGKANIFSAALSGATTFIAGIIPILTYLLLPYPIDIIISLLLVGGVIGIFLIRYRSKKSKVHWKITFLQTVIIITIAVVTSLLLGGSV